MLPFGVTIPATVPRRSEIPAGLTNYSVYENFALLGYYATSSVIYYLHFGTTYRSHLQGGFLNHEDGTPKRRLKITTTLYSLPLKMGLICCPETSVKITTTSCVITQKSAVLTYVAAEA